MEVFENTVANNAGIAKRAIERILECPITEVYRACKKAGLDRSDLGQIEETLDSLIVLASLNDDPLEEELRPKGWEAIREGANSDGWLYNEYNEYEF